MSRSNMTTNFVNLENLRSGIKRFQSQSGWPDDFHNVLYQQLLEAKHAGVTTNLWEFLVDELAAWRATRGRTKAEIRSRGYQRLHDLQYERTKILDHHNSLEPDLTTTTWEEVKDLFAIALWIKDVDTPMFASKLCHFLLTNTFPVADGAMLGIDTTTRYQEYWLRCQEEWAQCDQKDVLKRELQHAMSTVAIASYPWSAKITELCAMGANTGSVIRYSPWREI